MLKDRLVQQFAELPAAILLGTTADEEKGRP